MIRFMIDTDNLADLTGHAEILATYSDLVTDLAELQMAYPHSQIVLIDRGLGDPTGQASVFDIEPGALTPAQAVSKYDNAYARHVPYLTTYHDQDLAAAVDTAFGSRPRFNWDATLDGQAFIRQYDPLHTPAVVQCLSSTELDYHADGNLVFEDNWHPRHTVVVPASVVRDVNTLISWNTMAGNELHRLATAIGG